MTSRRVGDALGAISRASTASPPGPASGEYPRFAAGTGRGILQRAALLASSLETTNPFHRGALIRRILLCDRLPQPDPNSLPPGSLDPPPPSAATDHARSASP